MKVPGAAGTAHAPATRTLHPGDVVCAERGDRLDTLLGSCVAVVLTDPARTVAAMCHVVHAGAAGRRFPASSAFGPVAMQTMQAMLRARGLHPPLCEAYVYGGGHMFPDQPAAPDIGVMNANWALQALAEQGIRVLDTCLGGRVYRRVAWTVGPGAPGVVAVTV